MPFMGRSISGKAAPLAKLAIDLGLWLIAAPLAAFARVDVDWVEFAQGLLIYICLSVLVKIPALLAFKMHRQRWHTVNVRDLAALLQAVGLGTGVLFIVALTAQSTLGVPRSVPLIEGIISVLLLGGARLAVRLISEQAASEVSRESRKRVLVIGAGDTGAMITREMLRHPESGLQPVGFLDDDPGMRRESVLGLPVFGAVDSLPEIVQSTRADQILIAMPSASGEAIRKVALLADQARVTYRIIPAFHELLSGKASLSHIREVGIEDLLRRDPIQLNMGEIASYLKDQVVLVTGAGGSIGSEIARQVARFGPGRLILLDQYETGLYYLEREMEITFPAINRASVIATIQRREKLDQVFTAYQPQVVFHAAAHKHVPLMENNPEEAVLNNIGGTDNLLNSALAHQVKRFVNISTDKAVRPASVMGASKRVAEHLVQAAALRAQPGQIFVSVRFGNVLGSQGSVIPVFKEQIRRGGPITVTHPEMIRYFMTVPEAAQLVLQAGGLGQSGVVYILDMGDPVRILDLAHDLIRLSGLAPDIDIPIVYTGIRPGEKLFEELMTDQEGISSSKYEAILMAPQDGVAQAGLTSRLEQLYAAAAAQDRAKIIRLLRQLVPSYQPDNSAGLPIL